MADIEVRVIARDEYSSELNRLNAELRSLRATQEQLNAISQRSGVESTAQAFKQIENEIAAVEAKIASLNSSFSSLTSVALDERVKVPFAAAGREIDATKASIDRFVRSITTVNDVSMARGPATVISPRVLSDISAEINKVQSDASKAAHGVETAFSAVSVRPTVFKSITKELEDMQNMSSRAAHGISTAFVPGFMSATALSAAYKGLAVDIEKTATSAKKIGTATADGADLAVLSIRKMSSLGDELARHQTGAAISTIGSFIRQAGLLNAAINALSGPWGAFAAAGVAALAAVGYEAEQTYQRFASIRDTESELAIRGFGSGTDGTGPAALGASAQEFDTLQKQTSEYTGTVREMQTELNKLPSSAQGLRLSLGTMAESLSGLRHSSPVDELKRIVKEFDNGPDATLKYLNALLGLDGQMSRSGQTFGELIKNAQTTADKFQILGEIVNRFNEGSIGRAGIAAREANENLAILALGAAAAASSAGELGAIDYSSVDRFADAVKKATEPVKDLNTESTRLSETFIEQAAAIERGNAQLDKRREVLRDLANAEAGVARLQKENADLVGQRPKEGTSGRAPGIDTRPAERAAANLGARAERSPLDEAGERQHRINLDNIHNEAEARRADLQAQLQAAQERAAEERRYEAEKLTLGATPENRMSADEVSRRVEASEAVKKADEAVAEAQRRLSDESTQHQISNLRAIVTEEARGSQERINAQRQIIAIDQIQVALGREKPEKVDQDKVQLGNLIRQTQTRAFQEERDNARTAIIDAKDHANAVEEIAKAYDHLRAVSKQPGVPSATGAQINREEIRDLKSIQEQSFSRLEEFNHSAARLDDARLAAAKASLSAQVSAHQISKEQEARAEANLTSSYLGEQEKRVESELQIDGITEKEKQRLYQELAQLYTKDAEAQEKAQQKITAAIEEENQKRIQSFTTMFDSIGSGLEKVLTAELTGNLAERGAALRSFGQTLVSSTIKAITSQISDYAGRQLGPALGLTEEQSKGGLGEVLGSALAKSLGLLKDVPKDNQQKSVDLLQKAADAQGKANSLLGDVVKNTADTAKLIQELLNKIKADGSVKTVNGTQTSATGIAGTGAGVAPEASVTRSSIQIGGAATAPEGQPGTDIQAKFVPQQQSNLNLPALPDSPYIETARAAARQYNVPEDMFLHQIAGESEFNPRARNAVGQGHFGLGQFDPATARQYGVDVNDPTSSLYGAAHYMSDLRSQAGGFAPAMQRYLGSTSESSLQRVLSQNPQYAGAYRLAQQADTGDSKELGVNIQQLNSTTQSAVSVQRQAQSTTQQSIQTATQLNQSNQQSVQSIDKNTQADQQLKTSTDNAAQAYKQKPAGAPANDNSGSTSSASSGLSLLTQGLGIAGSAAAIFGGQLSTTARVALGVVGVLSQLSSFTKNATSTLGLFESSTKTATTATTLMQGASTINATAFATDTAAVQTNAAAQTTSAASSTGGSFLKAIPLIGGLFDRGGIVPSAAGGMIVPEGALAGGGQVSILHPREMVLPANISETVQNAARGRTSLPGVPSLSMPAPVTHNAANSNLTYAPQITGRFGSMSRTELNSVLRSHGDAFEGMARNLLRNNGLFRSAG